jgi:hypothetical protein
MNELTARGTKRIYTLTGTKDKKYLEARVCALADIAKYNKETGRGKKTKKNTPQGIHGEYITMTAQHFIKHLPVIETIQI